MDDLMAKLQSILGTKEGQEQLKNIQSMLNNSGSQQAENPPPQNGGFDLSSLANMFSSMPSSPPQESPKAAENETGGNNNNNNNGGFDLSSIMSMLGGLGGGANNSSNNAAPSGMPNIDINMIMKLQQVFSSMNVSDKNSQLLLALKPHFSEQRSKKVDQAISMMRLFSMMPMLKESGIFAGL